MLWAGSCLRAALLNEKFHICFSMACSAHKKQLAHVWRMLTLIKSQSISAKCQETPGSSSHLMCIRWGLKVRGLCYHSYVTECAEWQGGARSLIGVNTCGVERGLSLHGDAQSMRVKRSTQQALKGSSFIYLLRWILEGGGGRGYKAFQRRVMQKEKKRNKIG